MSATITWTIQSMTCVPQIDGQSDVVITASWNCTASEEVNGVTYKGYAANQSSFMLDPSAGFTPYDQLTQEQVLDWCWASGVNKDAAEEAAAQDLDTQINPPVVQLPLPWVTPAA